MTSTETPERASSPKSPTQIPEQPAETETHKPVASADSPVSISSPAPGYTHAEEPTNVSPSAEADHATSTLNEQPVPDTPARPQGPEQPTERISPEAESLKAMFPDFDTGIIQSVLESVDGNQERAADVLLGMSDPSYVSQHHSAPTQSELDEQFARRLLLEEQQQQAAWHPDQPYPHSQDQRRDQNVPYQPRAQQGYYPGGVDRWGDSQAPGDGGGGKDTMSEVQEQFSKFAETGKKTFSSLVSKVKAKMQEFDQSRNASGSGSAPQTSWGTGTPSRTEGVPPSQTQNNQYSTMPAGQPTGPPSVDTYNVGYDVTPQAQASPVGGGQILPSVTSSSTTSVPPAERIPARPPSAGPPPAGNVDPSKIGMLPKRPVSLLGTSPPQSNTNVRHDADEDELDYVENPFEEGRK
ncbi:uncharacterized protein FOMMEDRAFT_146546 [Fomitiporia mediterranea MF3/22]|uniref:uncharacterized protein n=1 Tax=Fomitiporia mediterranea (strain MF3/22) TaxID=694068 RepID=UPI0004409CC2|nr:uncharacterized protein FOMMEDRAFT_146546 [Fomitiporia mediterranea MF3/22]EJD02659.1 hypothetical protein FOMMEDRAFT_146546 [Fomitiporia mediterranea MF3/22]